ncbi:hypothetical protein BT69DRAFT_1225516 [Atractiella rhizophila]|nr:hypothetical protein BT69DRAFT_1225516 [Atractiella rhizophila]
MADFLVSDSENAPDGIDGADPSSQDVLTNLILLEGPTGSGKSAAVRAVAQELEWEIFEVWPGMERGRKELEKAVGEVGRNHQVSGMNSTKNQAGNAFSRLMGGTSTKTIVVLDDEEVESANAGKKKAKFKQSLILLEEVDILFKDDKEFWPAVVDLVGNSLRPVVMTCNDASLIPADTLPIQTILHFPSTPPDHSMHLLRLVALSEGHIVPDAELAMLAEYGDLRKALTELQYRCQWAMGDTMGGLGWMAIDEKREGLEFSSGSILPVRGDDSANANMDVSFKDLTSTLERKSVADAYFGWDFEEVEEVRFPS